MTNSSPDISFITICYNGFKDTCELIESLHKKLKSVSYEIIVVDNASREDEAAKIHELYPTVISIRSNENGGFSGGNNIGIRAAKGKYIFLINKIHISNPMKSPTWWNDWKVVRKSGACLLKYVSPFRRNTYSLQDLPR